MEDTLEAYVNRCVICGVDMGDCNPRQLCGKTYCMMEAVPSPAPAPALLPSLTDPFDLLISDLIDINIDAMYLVNFLKNHRTNVRIYEDQSQQVRFVELDDKLIIKFNKEIGKINIYRYSILTSDTNVLEWSLICGMILPEKWVLNETFQLDVKLSLDV